MPEGSQKYVRRFTLASGEYHRNFHKIDRETIDAVTSERADAVTPLMAKIYLRLITAPTAYWEREGVLRFEAELREAGQLKAWTILCQLLGVASATARKAISWMHEEGIIGYFAGKNGVGIRIFVNRAASSIGSRPEPARQIFLRAPHGSSQAARVSANEPAFNDSKTVLETSDKELKTPAPKNSAATLSEGGISIDEIITRLRQELEPSLTKAAGRAASEEMARTREWFETRALPKAVRVAQHETYDLIKRETAVNEKAVRTKADLQVGHGTSPNALPAPQELTELEIEETAELCVSMLQAQGKPIETTLAEISTDEGGWLLLKDQSKVRTAAQKLLLRA